MYYGVDFSLRDWHADVAKIMARYSNKCKNK